MGGDERRSSQRRDVRVRVDYQHEGNYLISYSRDLSPDGVFVCTPHPAPIGESVTLVFPVEELHEITVTATVVWTPPPGSAAQPGMGLQFVDLPETLREALLESVHRVAVLAESDPADEPCGSA